MAHLNIEEIQALLNVESASDISDFEDNFEYSETTSSESEHENISSATFDPQFVAKTK